MDYKYKKYDFITINELPQIYRRREDGFIYSDEIKESIVYYAPNEGRAAFICPCGCGETILISVIKSAEPIHPNWAIEGNTIKPSINKLTGCCSHFTIKNGIVE